MSSSPWTLCVCVLTCLLSCSVPEDQQQITVMTGDDVTLQCLDPRGGDIELLVWTRQDPEEDVFVWKHGNMFEDDQHESFKNRVELRDSQMKDGDVSLIVKNVNIKDTGTYECYVRNSNTYGPPPQLITSITLTVRDSDPQVKTVQHGKDVLLRCQGPRGADIVFVRWIRPDLESEGSVFFFRDDRTYENYQHPLFHGRVELRDSQMKDGDVSVILENVNIKDTGTYECHVRIKGNRPWLISRVQLQVKDSGGGAGHTEDGGDKDGHVGLVVGLSVVTVLLVAAVVFSFSIFRKYKRLKEQIYEPPPDKAVDLELYNLTLKETEEEISPSGEMS